MKIIFDLESKFKLVDQFPSISTLIWIYDFNDNLENKNNIITSIDTNNNNNVIVN